MKIKICIWMIVSSRAWLRGAFQISVGPSISRPAHQIPIRIPAPAAGFPEKFWRTGWPTPRQPAKSQGEHRTNVRIDANGRARARHRLLGRTRSRIRRPRQGWDSRRGFLLCDISIKNLSSVVHQVRVLAVL